MSQKTIYQNIKLTKSLLWLITVLLAFVLLLVFIWLWYDLKMTSLEKEQNGSGTTFIHSNR